MFFSSGSYFVRPRTLWTTLVKGLDGEHFGKVILNKV